MNHDLVTVGLAEQCDVLDTGVKVEAFGNRRLATVDFRLGELQLRIPNFAAIGGLEHGLPSNHRRCVAAQSPSDCRGNCGSCVRSETLRSFGIRSLRPVVIDDLGRLLFGSARDDVTHRFYTWGYVYDRTSR